VGDEKGPKARFLFRVFARDSLDQSVRDYLLHKVIGGRFGGGRRLRNRRSGRARERIVIGAEAVELYGVARL
jgi:hypothetical protein